MKDLKLVFRSPEGYCGCHGNQFLLTVSTQFFATLYLSPTDLRPIFRKLGCDHSTDAAMVRSIRTFFSPQWPMCNKLWAFSHDALDRHRCNTQGRPSTSSVDHTNDFPWRATVNKFLFFFNPQDWVRGVTQPSGAPVTYLGQGPSPLI